MASYPSERHDGKVTSTSLIRASQYDYSAMAIDQAHKQANDVIRGDCGAV